MITENEKSFTDLVFAPNLYLIVANGWAIGCPLIVLTRLSFIQIPTIQFICTRHSP